MPSPLTFDLESVPAIVGQALEQAQRSAATHRKNIAILHKLLLTSSNIVEKLANGKGTRLVGEKTFVDAIKDAVNKLVTVKKGVQQADRCIKFLSGFVAYTVEQASANDSADSAASRLTSSLLRHLLKGFTAKDKNVRFRCTQFVATVITGLGELDDNDYVSLKAALIERVKDKESAVRVQAVVALSKLQNPDDLDEMDFSEDADEETQGEEHPTKVLIDIMRHDPSGEVRRAAMSQVTLHPTTLPSILSRARDIDPLNRKFLYASSLAELPSMTVLDLAQRELIVRHGCKDREDAVKKAARALLAKWAGDLPGGLVELAGLFDCLGETKIAETAINTVIELRQDLAGQLDFSDAFWVNLAPETSLLARLYIAYCKEVNDELRLEACLPVITALAFRIEHAHSCLIELVAQVSALPVPEEEDEESEEAVEQRHQLREATFVAEQLLQIALMEDYGDEIGRRKMFTLIRDMVSEPILPAGLIPACMDVLLKLSSHEKDFMRVVVEIVQNVREDVSNVSGEANETDGDDDEEELDLDTATPEDIAEDQRKRRLKAAKKIQNQQLDPDKKETHIRCLALVQALLERVAGSVQENATLLGMIHELIVPSVKSKEPEIREQGLLCLGLCSLLDKNMALDAFGLYVHQSQETEGELQVKIFQIVFDILMLYGLGFLEGRGHGPEVVIEFILHALNQDSHQVQATAAMGISKLMLSGMITDSEVLKRLVLAYFAPETLDNLELRQCLSYFFPVYCYSLPANMKRMQEIFLPTFEILTEVYEDLDDQSVMVSPTQLANQLLDWTDPQKAVATEGNPTNEGIQVDLAFEIVKGIYREKKKDTRKLLAQLLGKLHIPDSVDEVQLRNLLLLVSQLEQHRPIKDTVTRNAVTKFDTSLRKLAKRNFPVLDGEEFDKMLELYEAEQYLTATDFLKAVQQENEDNPGSDEESFVQAVKKKATPKKRAVSKTPSSRGNNAGKIAKGASTKTPPVEPEEAEADPDVSIASTGTRRSGRKAKPVARKAQPIIEEESEEEESSEATDDDSDAQPSAVNAASDTDDTM